MTPSRGLVPSPEYQTGLDALQRMVNGATRVQGAVAFVTQGGVQCVEDLRSIHPEVAWEIVARGTPITEPDALIRLEELDVAVSVVVGSNAEQFHPKLWLAHRPDGLSVLSGSGNLTAGGMQTNDEQFELLKLSLDEGDAIAEQKERFARLVGSAVGLDQVRGTPYWTAWEQQLKKRRLLDEQTNELDEMLFRTADAARAVEALYADLLKFYERTKNEVTITTSRGDIRPYVASYFKRAIDECHGKAGPVTVVANMVKKPTLGFDHLANAERPDLMVETLVLDVSKPYHHLFSAPTVAQAQANLDAYWDKRKRA
jgi:HKD family nuclease